MLIILKENVAKGVSFFVISCRSFYSECSSGLQCSGSASRNCFI